MRLRHRGVTIVELMIVVVILGLILAFAGPKIDVMKYRIESSMQGIGLTFLTAERQAISQQHDIIVEFDVAHNALKIHEDKNNNGVIDAGERVRSVPLGDNVVFGRGSATAMTQIGNGPISFTMTVNGYLAVTFHRDGSASGAGGFYLTSTRAATTTAFKQDCRAVWIDRATGRASWFRYNQTSNTWVRAF